MKIWTTLLLSLNLCLPLAAAFQEIPDKALLPILNPTLKEQKTEKIRLSNGLEAVLVSNPTLQEAAVNIVVKAGSYQNPKNHPGLAHFLEHMLFLGTDEYPVEMEFARFLSEHAGDMNAYTASDYTSYQFSISPSGLPEALKRVSSFFKSPLLSKSGVKRELNAIDQEFEKGYNSEGKIAFQVLQDLTNPQHPGHEFTSGNSLSLANTSPDDLREWFLTHYSPERMRLYIIAPLPLDQLAQMVDQDFSTIPERKTEPLKISENMFTKDRLGTEVLIGLTKNLYELTILWEIPPSMPLNLEDEPEDLIAYLFSDQSAGSVFAALKKEGLAENISSDSIVFTPESRLFEIDITLTEKGYKEKNRVIESIFAMIELVKKQGYPQALHHELAQLKKQRYQFQEHETPFDWARKQGEWLAREPIDTYPELSQTIGPFDAKATMSFLDLLKPEKGLYIVFAPSQAITEPLPEKERWMGIAYKSSKIPQDLLSQWDHPQSIGSLSLNNKNPWIALDTSHAQTTSTRSQYPHLPTPVTLFDQQGAKIYYSQDTLYDLPRSFIRLQLQSPLLQAGKPKKAVLGDLYARLLEQKMFGMIYQAKMADTTIKIEQTIGSIQITLEGFTESVQKLYPTLIQEIATAAFTKEDFFHAKEMLEREYQNNLLDMPLKQSFDYLKGALIEGFSTNSQKKQVLNSVTREDLTLFQTQFFQKNFIQAMIAGSLSEEEAKGLGQLTTQTFQRDKEAIGKAYTPILRSLNLCKGPCLLSYPTHAQGNALLLVIGTDEYSPETRNLQQLLSLATWEAFFTELRTKQQTGYLVASDAVDLYKNLISYFSVQSTKYQPEELLWRFERFLENYVANVQEQEVTKDRFAPLKEGLRHKLTEPPGSFSLYGELLFKLAFEVNDFNWLETRVQELDLMTYDQFITFAKEFLGRDNPRRLAVMLLDKNAKTPFSYTAYNSLNALLKAQIANEKPRKFGGKQKVL